MSVNLKRLVQDWALEVVPVMTFRATVRTVDVNAKTCTVDLPGDAPELPGVLLRGFGGGVLEVPAANSEVLVQLMNNSPDTAVILDSGTLESVLIELKCGTKISADKNGLVKVDASTIQLKGDSLGGLVKVDALTQRLNAIEQTLELLKGALSAAATAAVGASPAGEGPFQTTLNSALLPWNLGSSQATALQNQNVKHA